MKHTEIQTHQRTDCTIGPMSSDAPKQSLFSSLTLGRISRSSKASSETLTHPLLGASTSSVNLGGDAVNAEAGPSSLPGGGQAKPAGSRSVSAGGIATSLPYKPRTRGLHGSTSSITNVIGSGNINMGSPGLAPAAVTPASPVTPTGVAAPSTTSMSTSATFALPASLMDAASGLDTTATPQYGKYRRQCHRDYKVTASKFESGCTKDRARQR